MSNSVTLDYTRSDGEVELPDGRVLPRIDINEEMNRILWDYAADVMCEGIDLGPGYLEVWYGVFGRAEITDGNALAEDILDDVDRLLVERGLEVAQERAFPWIGARVRFSVPESSFLYFEAQ